MQGTIYRSPIRVDPLMPTSFSTALGAGTKFGWKPNLSIYYPFNCINHYLLSVPPYTLGSHVLCGALLGILVLGVIFLLPYAY